VWRITQAEDSAIHWSLLLLAASGPGCHRELSSSGMTLLFLLTAESTFELGANN
jgi:hypothetical protein